MKYIKTKDGIYELEELFGTEYVETVGGGTQATYKRLKDMSIDYDRHFGCKTKQADSIEELCDAMVAKYSDESFPRVIDMQAILKTCRFAGIKMQEHFPFLFDTHGGTLEYIVGAIWIGEGNLKAVAKFDGEGEAKLI